MNLSDKIQLIKKHLSDDNQKGVFENLSRLIAEIKDNEFEGDLILLQSMYNSFEKEKRVNIISSSEYIQGMNKIKFSLLAITNDIESKYSNEKELEINLFVETAKEMAISLGKKAKLIYEIKGGQVIRQKSINSTFSLPNRSLNDPIWKKWIKDYHFELQQERFWIGKHLQDQYAKLIIMPFKETDYKIKNPEYAITRLRILKDFIESNKDRIDIVTITDKEIETKSLAIIGESFYAESKTRDKQNKNWTNISFSSKNVLKKIEMFDEEFYEILNKKRLDIFSSREKSIKDINKEIKRLKDRIAKKEK